MSNPECWNDTKSKQDQLKNPLTLKQTATNQPSLTKKQSKTTSWRQTTLHLHHGSHRAVDRPAAFPKKCLTHFTFHTGCMKCSNTQPIVGILRLFHGQMMVEGLPFTRRTSSWSISFPCSSSRPSFAHL